MSDTMKLPLSPQELALPYAKFYELPVDGPTEEELHWFDQPLPPDQVLPIDQAANFVKGGNSFIGAPNGYFIFPDGRSYTANCMFLPGVTVELSLWWFQWLNCRPKSVPREQGNLRYKIWCPLDHWDHGYLLDGDPSSGTRLAESFDRGAGDPPKYMISKGGDPSALGITEELLEAARREGRFPGVGCGFDANGVPTGVGVNQFRNVPGGCEWSSRSWGGYTISDGKLVKLEQFTPANPADCRNEMLHNLTEGRHLSKLLPLLYPEYKDKPFDED